MEPTVPVPLRTHCPKCSRPVTVFMSAWNPAEPPRTQEWKCPHCHDVNRAELPGKVGWIAARQDS